MSWLTRLNIPEEYGPASFRYNNPGAAYPSQHDERYGLEGYGVIGGGHKIGKFPSPVHGAAANMDLFARNYTGMPLSKAINKWRGGNGDTSVPEGYDPDMVVTREMTRDPNFMTGLFAKKAAHESGRGSALDDAGWRRAHEMFLSGGAGDMDPTTTQTPGAFGISLPEDYQDEMGLFNRIADARREALKSYEPEDISWQRGLGGALQAVGGAVSAWEGNHPMSQMLLSNNYLTQHAAERDRMARRLADAKMTIGDDAITGAGTYAAGVLSSERQRRNAARKQAAETLAIYGRGADGIEAAATILEGAGLRDDAAKLRGASGGSAAPSTPAAPGATPTSPGDDLPSVPGISVSPAMGAPQAAPVGAPGITEGGLPDYLTEAQAEVEELERQRQMASALGNKDLATLLDKKIDDTLASTGLKKFRESQSDAVVKRAFDDEKSRRDLMKASPEARQAALTASDQLGEVMRIIDKHLLDDGTGNITVSPGAAANVGSWWNANMPNQPGGAAADAWADLTRLKDLFSVEGLQALRASGVAPGNMTEKEWPMMAARFGKIEEGASKDYLAETLHNARRILSGLQDGVRAKYEGTYGEPLRPADQTARTSGGGEQVQRQSGQPATGAVTPEVARGYMDWIVNSKPGDLKMAGSKLFRKLEDGDVEEVPGTPGQVVESDGKLYYNVDGKFVEVREESGLFGNHLVEDGVFGGIYPDPRKAK